MTITREINGETVNIELTDRELRIAYYEEEENRDKDWITDLLLEYGYDADKMRDDDIESIAADYRRMLEEGDGLGELEHSVFESVIDEYDCPLLEDDDDKEEE